MSGKKREVWSVDAWDVNHWALDGEKIAESSAAIVFGKKTRRRISQLEGKKPIQRIITLIINKPKTQSPQAICRSTYKKKKDTSKILCHVSPKPNFQVGFFRWFATPEIPVVIPRVLECMRHSRVDASTKLIIPLRFWLSMSMKIPLIESFNRDKTSTRLCCCHSKMVQEVRVPRVLLSEIRVRKLSRQDV